MSNREIKLKQVHSLIADFIGTAMQRMAEKSLQKKISFAQLRLLFVLAHSEPATINELAKKLSIGQSAASLLVDRLVTANLAERITNVKDRRKALVSLSQEGKVLMGQGQSEQQHLVDWLHKLSELQLEMLTESFQILIDIGSPDLSKK